LGANKHHHNVLEKNLLTNACIIFSLFGSRSFPLHARTTFWYRTNKNAQWCTTPSPQSTPVIWTVYSDVNYSWCRKQRLMLKRMDYSSWKHPLKPQPMWTMCFTRSVSIHTVNNSTLGCISLWHANKNVYSLLLLIWNPSLLAHLISAKRLLQGQQTQNPQAGMVLSQRPTERMVSSSSCCSS
jgi:hypothetical protein